MEVNRQSSVLRCIDANLLGNGPSEKKQKLGIKNGDEADAMMLTARFQIYNSGKKGINLANATLLLLQAPSRHVTRGEVRGERDEIGRVRVT